MPLKPMAERAVVMTGLPSPEVSAARLVLAAGGQVLAAGFALELNDDAPEERGCELRRARRCD